MNFQFMKKYIANIITGSRIIFSLPLVFIPLSSAWFYIFYLFCGLTDMIDGAIARRTGAVSKFGATLDTVADFVFVVVSLYQLLPSMHITAWLWVWSSVIAVIKICNIIWGYVIEKHFISLQQNLHRITISQPLQI